MTHFICKQYLHIDFNSTENEASALHGKLSDWCSDQLFPALERALDRCAPADGYWSVERLEIDAGTIAIDRLEQDLSALIEQSLEKALRAQTIVHLYPDLSSIPKSSFHPGETKEITQKSAQQRLISAWIYFLTTGALPWNIRLSEGKSLEQVLLQEWQENPSGISHSLLSVLAEANARKRLVRQFSEPFLTKLLAHIAPDLKRQLAAVLQTVGYSDLPVEAVKPFVTGLWEQAFEPGNQTETEIIRRAWQTLALQSTSHAGLANLLEQHWPGTTDSPLPTANAKKQAASKTSGISSDVKAPDKRLPFPVPSGIAADTSSLRVFENTTNEPNPDASEGIYIDNAGLVILHPFLPQLFSALNIAENDRLIRPERALCLLHFLITGQTVAPEYELVLPKVLCNIPLTTPVESDVALKQAELEEAEALLAAVIRHWSVLKSTGIDGLRGAFLLRTGKIALRYDGDWLLQIENKGHDILLEQLPWGIGAIRLPWMDRMLWVEWTA